MQALWSRAGQAHHCGCKACFNAAGGMIRQSATRVMPRKPTFCEIFTTCYTGIMASAAVIDAKFKEKRRLELDRQLEVARKELEILKRRYPPRELDENEPPPGSTENRYPGAMWDHRPQKGEIAECLNTLRDVHGYQKPLRKTTQVRAWLETYGSGTSDRASDALFTTDYATWEKRLMSEEINPSRNMVHRMPKTMVHLEAAEFHMVRMVDRLLRDCLWIWDQPLWHDICDSAEYLRRKDLPNYERSTNMVAITEYSAKLNSALRAILANDSYSRREKVKKILHNLLVSPQPPTIYTYNLLILGFDRLRLHNLAKGVIGALLTSRREPTRSTIVCLLHHFKDKGDDEGFFKLLQRLTGEDPRGINVRRKTIDEVDSSNLLFRWATSKDVAINDEYVIERAWLDLDIFTAIIHALLKFGYVRHAAAVFALGLKNDIKFTMQTTSHLLESAMSALDRKAASQVLHAIETRPRLLQASFTKQKDQEHLARCIENLLDICISQRKLASVAPWLHVPKTALVSEQQRQGMRITVLIHEMNRSRAKIHKFYGDFGNITGIIYRRRKAGNTQTKEAYRLQTKQSEEQATWVKSHKKAPRGKKFTLTVLGLIRKAGRLAKSVDVDQDTEHSLEANTSMQKKPDRYY